MYVSLDYSLLHFYRCLLQLAYHRHDVITLKYLFPVFSYYLYNKITMKIIPHTVDTQQQYLCATSVFSSSVIANE
jgi:hypothetical protein